MLPASSTRQSRTPLQHVNASNHGEEKISRFSSFRRKLTHGHSSSSISGRSHPWNKRDDDDDNEYNSDSDVSTALSSDYEGSIESLTKSRRRRSFSFEKIHSIRSIPRLSPPSRQRRHSPNAHPSSPPKHSIERHTPAMEMKQPRRLSKRKNAIVPPTSSPERHGTAVETVEKQPRRHRTKKKHTHLASSPQPLTSPLREPLIIEDHHSTTSRTTRRQQEEHHLREPLLSPRGPLSRRPPSSKEGPNAPTPQRSNTSVGYTNRILLGETSPQKHANPLSTNSLLARSTYEVDAPCPTPPPIKKTASIHYDAQFEQDSWQNASVGSINNDKKKKNSRKDEQSLYDIDQAELLHDQDTQTLRTLEGTVEKLRAEARVLASHNRKNRALRPVQLANNDEHVQDLLQKTEKRLASYKARTNYNQACSSSIRSLDSWESYDSARTFHRQHYPPRAIVTTTSSTTSIFEQSSPSRQQQLLQISTCSSTDVELTDVFSWKSRKKNKNGKSRRRKHHTSSKRKRTSTPRTGTQATIWREAPIWSEDESYKSLAREAPMWTSSRDGKQKSSRVHASRVTATREAPMWTGNDNVVVEPPKQDEKPPEKDYRQFFAALSATFSDDLAAVASVETPPSDRDYLHFFAHLTQSRDDLTFDDDKSWQSTPSSGDASPTPPSIESSVSSDDDETLDSIEPLQFSASLEESIKSESLVMPSYGSCEKPKSKRTILRWSNRFTQYTY